MSAVDELHSHLEEVGPCSDWPSHHSQGRKVHLPTLKALGDANPSCRWCLRLCPLPTLLLLRGIDKLTAPRVTRVLRSYTDQDIPRAFCSNPVEALSSQHFEVEVLEVSWGHSSDLSPDKAQALKVLTLAQGWNRTSSFGNQGSRSPT